jgi:hypothetical protein
VDKEVCVSDLQTILGLIGRVQSQDELKTISSALTSRWKMLQGAVAQKTIQDKGILPGQAVSFVHAGRRHYGTVKTINPKTCSVDVQGRHWRVSPQLLQKEDKLPETKKRSEAELMEEIMDCYGGLSPENLSCDGEASRAHMQARSRELNGRLQAAFRELGRNVSEDEAYEWERKNPHPAQPGTVARRPLFPLPPVP